MRYASIASIAFDAICQHASIASIAFDMRALLALHSMPYASIAMPYASIAFDAICQHCTEAFTSFRL